MRILLWTLLTAALIYAADWAYVAINPRYETVHLERFLIVREKFNKVSYSPADAHDERCVHAMFPHAGNRPCWYLKRHRTELVDMN